MDPYVPMAMDTLQDISTMNNLINERPQVTPKPSNGTYQSFSGNQTKIVHEKRHGDPSSCIQSKDRYPIPGFFEYRSKPRNYDLL